jgi:hypothetical protein
VIAALAIAAVFTRYSPADIAREVGRGETLAVVPYALLLMLVNLAFVSGADAIILRACTGRPGWPAVAVGKAGAAILGAIGYAASHGGYGLWMARKTGSGLGLTSGMVLYIMGSELAAVAIVATASIHLAGADVDGPLRFVAPGLAAVLVALQLLGPTGWLGRGRALLLEPWRRVSARQALLQQTVRIAQITWMVSVTWLAARAFGMPIPASVMAAYLPIVLVVGSLPVNVAGFGAVQLAWLRFTPWAPGEQVLAFSFVWQLMCGAAMIVRGLPFMRRVIAEIDAGAPPKDSDPA